MVTPFQPTIAIAAVVIAVVVIVILAMRKKKPYEAPKLTAAELARQQQYLQTKAQIATLESQFTLTPTTQILDQIKALKASIYR